MILALWIFVGLVVFTFGLVVFFGAPYLPTLKQQVDSAFELLNLSPGERLIEVGSGDGRVLLAAAERGINVVGYELNPLLVIWSLWITRKYKDKVRVVWGNAFNAKWQETDGVYVFGLEKLMLKVYKKIIQSNSQTVKLVSIGFPLKGHEPMGKKNGVFLYHIKPSS